MRCSAQSLYALRLWLMVQVKGGTLHFVNQCTIDVRKRAPGINGRGQCKRDITQKRADAMRRPITRYNLEINHHTSSRPAHTRGLRRWSSIGLMAIKGLTRQPAQRGHRVGNQPDKRSENSLRSSPLGPTCDITDTPDGIIAALCILPFRRRMTGKSPEESGQNESVLPP